MQQTCNREMNAFTKLSLYSCTEFPSLLLDTWPKYCYPIGLVSEIVQCYRDFWKWLNVVPTPLQLSRKIVYFVETLKHTVGFHPKIFSVLRQWQAQVRLQYDLAENICTMTPTAQPKPLFHRWYTGRGSKDFLSLMRATNKTTLI